MQTILHGSRVTFLHFTTECGRNAVGGIGTFIDELRRVSSPDVAGFALLAGHEAQPLWEDPAPNLIHADFYDMDVLNRLDFDIAVFHQYGLAYLADESFLRGRRLIYVVHSVPTVEPWSLLDPYGGHDDIARAFEKLCDAADTLVCVSEAERSKLLLLYPDMADKTTFIRNGFSAFADQPLLVRSDRRTFGFLGRADYRKGLRELVREWTAIDGDLRIGCGAEDGTYASLVRDDIERLGLVTRVHWKGRVPPDAKLPFLRSLDALLVPSRWEPFGYVALEALRAGIAPIVSKQGGMLEILGEDYRYAFDPSRRGAIAEAVTRFRGDEAFDVRSVLERARKHAETLTAERMCASYARLALPPTTTLTPRPEHPKAFARYAKQGGLPSLFRINASETPRPSSIASSPGAARKPE